MPRVMPPPQSITAVLPAALAELLRTDLPPAQFAEQWLARVVSAAAGRGGCLHRPTSGGVLACVASVGTIQAKNDKATSSDDSDSQLLLETYSTGRSKILAGLNDANLSTATASDPYVFAPLLLDGEIRGVIELRMPADSPAAQHREAIQAVALACGYFAEYERRQRQRALNTRQSLMDEVERFTRSVHEKLSVRHTAYVAANDGRRLVGSDRLTVLLRRGKRYDVLAVSGVDAVENRSQVAKLLGRLAGLVAATGEPLHYDGRSDELPPQLRDAVNAYVDETHVRSVSVMPLLPPVDEPKQKKRPQPLGAIVIEQIEDVAPAEGREQRAQFVAQHTTAALTKALEHEAIPLLPLWRGIAGVASLFAPGSRAKTWAVITLLAAAAAALKFIPADFALHARGVLQPIDRQHVFAPFDGTVKAIHVGHGDHVTAGQLLIELRNTDLDVSLADVTGQRTAAYEQLLAVERSLYEDSSRIGVEERHRLAGQRSELKQKLVSLDEQLRLLRRKRDALRIVSPITGEVTTWDVEALLRDRPIRQGQILLDVADVAGPWELELQVPEDGIGQLLNAQETDKSPLRVSYRLASEPRTDRAAEIREVHYAAEIRGEEGNTVLAKATLTGDDLPSLRPGAEATAKVYCGQRALGYVWLHDAVDFVRTKILFRLY